MPNLLANLPLTLPDELLQTLVSAPGLRVERIVSLGHASPADFWYDQSEHEWVLLVQGAARLQIECLPSEATPGSIDEVELQPGDYVLLPAHRRHRVAWTHPTEHTIWLAIFFGATMTTSRS